MNECLFWGKFWFCAMNEYLFWRKVLVLCNERVPFLGKMLVLFNERVPFYVFLATGGQTLKIALFYKKDTIARKKGTFGRTPAPPESAHDYRLSGACIDLLPAC
jgi:hypothetical protein